MLKTQLSGLTRSKKLFFELFKKIRTETSQIAFICVEKIAKDFEKTNLKN